MSNIAKIDIDDFFKEGAKSLLKREADINTLLLRLTVIVNELVENQDKLLNRMAAQTIRLNDLVGEYRRSK